MGSFKDNFKLLRKHPIFPVLAFIVLASIIKENYPFSHFSMYSNPGSSVRMAYLTDANDEPLRIQYHTGLSTSKVSKTLNKERGPLEIEAKKAGKDMDSEETLMEINRVAGEEVLKAARALSLTRAKQAFKKFDGGERGQRGFDRFFLREPFKLYEITVTIRDGKLVNDTILIAEIPAAKEPPEFEPTEK